MNIEGLSREQRDLMECIGLEAYGKLVKAYGGSRIYIAKPDTVGKSKRNESIRREFDGRNYRFLANKYGLSENHIRLILTHNDNNI